MATKTITVMFECDEECGNYIAGKLCPGAIIWGGASEWDEKSCEKYKTCEKCWKSELKKREISKKPTV